MSLYSTCSVTVPSQEKIYQQLLVNNATSFAGQEDGDAGNVELYLIQQGLTIQHEQYMVSFIMRRSK